MAEKDKDEKPVAPQASGAAADNPAPKGEGGVPDVLDETPPKAHKGVPTKPVADANPPSTGGINLMNTAGLTPAQRARIEGTVLDGQRGGALQGIEPSTGRPLGGERVGPVVFGDETRASALAERDEAERNEKADK